MKPRKIAAGRSYTKGLFKTREVGPTHIDQKINVPLEKSVNKQKYPGRKKEAYLFGITELKLDEVHDIENSVYLTPCRFSVFPDKLFAGSRMMW